MLRRWHVIGLLFGCALFVACGSSPAPAAPTTTTMPATSTAIDLNVLTPNGTPGAGTQVPVVGIVAQVSGACPDLAFVLSGVTVHLSSRTRFESGGCSEIQEGMRAGAIGARRADGSVDAQRVKVGSPPPTPVGGVVRSLTGACPALTFILNDASVHTSSKTVFDGGACSDLKDGMRAGAIGHRAGDGAIDADHVKMAAAPPKAPPAPRPAPPVPPPVPVVSGPVTSVTGACPDLTFAIGRATVHTAAKTAFEGGACADVKVGVKVGASGPKRSDGSIDAERVRLATR